VILVSRAIEFEVFYYNYHKTQIEDHEEVV
jgi:hypothetical protein